MSESFKEGAFALGCNYWASHAGTNMWQDWRPEIVREDLRQLAASGLKGIRCFPLWPDFQPLACLKGNGGFRVEMRVNGKPVRYGNAIEEAGVSPLMMARFKDFADEAEESGLKLIVGLVTGWMSGRLFVPPAFENLNALADPFVVAWQIRYVRAFAAYFKDHPAIAAWDLGNECNCMGHLADRDSAFLWTSSIANAIKAADASHPVVSGMHGLQVFSGEWRIEDQAEACDLLTTHPYPIFTPCCDHDALDGIRSGLHATAETRLYSDIGGKPCMIEEFGTLGPMIADDETAARYVRTTLLSGFANDCRAALWWCAYDQAHLAHPPYSWNAVERELGLFRKNREPKPIASVYKEFSALLAKLPVLPPRIIDAVCILTKGQDSWKAAFSSFILAKQAGFEIKFQSCERPLQNSSLYLLPSLSGDCSMSKDAWDSLFDKVRSGATLYLSSDDALISSFRELVGLEVANRSRRTESAAFSVDGERFSCSSKFKLALKAAGAEIIGREDDGTPCFTAFRLGKGLVYFLSVPIETHIAVSPGAFAPNAPQFSQLYRRFASPLLSGKVLEKGSPMLGITEHQKSDGSKIICAINYSGKEIAGGFSFKAEWGFARAIYGRFSGTESPVIPPNDALIFEALPLKKHL